MIFGILGAQFFIVSKRCAKKNVLYRTLNLKLSVSFFVFFLLKKWLTLRGAQGKSKCWLRRKVKPVQAEDEKRNLVFGMIDLNLVQRVLKMSLISKSHLKWCRQRLENLDFIEDRVVRGRITHMFPSS